MERRFDLTPTEAETIMRIAKVVAPNITKGGIEYSPENLEFILSTKTVPIVEFIMDFVIHKGAIYLSGRQFPIPLQEQNTITNDFMKDVLIDNPKNEQFLMHAVRYLNKKIRP